MKILFDATELSPESAKSIGIYRYALGLASALARSLQPGETMLVLCNGDNQAGFASLVSSHAVRVEVIQPHMPGHLWRQWWTRLGCARLVAREKVDVYLSPKGFVPGWLGWPRGARRVCVLHDLIPFWYFTHRPQQFSWLERWLVSGAYRHSARHADAIVAISESTRTELQAWGVDGSRISMVHNGVDSFDGEGFLGEAPSVQGPFIFAMASDLPHKNLPGVLAAYAVYRQRAQATGVVSWPLLVCGARGVQQEGVVALGRVSEAALRGLYQGASLFLFLSLVEGFGYPPIEALSAGTPVLCSRLPVFEEVCADLVSYVDPADAQAAGAAIVALTSGPWSDEQRHALSARAKVHIALRFNWERCAQGVMGVLRDMTGSSRCRMGGVEP
jgi:glycosyltransferase involved in cell wall biosynthesis